MQSAGFHAFECILHNSHSEYLLRNQVQAAYQPDLDVQGETGVLYNVSNVYCTSVPCVLYKMCILYCTVCTVCIIHGVYFTSKFILKKRCLMSNVIQYNLMFFFYQRNSRQHPYKEGLYLFETMFCILVQCARCAVCVVQSTHLKNPLLTKRTLI